MARGLYFTLTTGQRVNFAQVRFWIVAGLDIIVEWNSGTAASDITVFAGGATDAAAIDAFLGASQDMLIENNPLITQHDGTLIIDDTTPIVYDRELFIRENMTVALNAFFGNQDTLDALQQAEARQGQNAVIAFFDKVYTAAERAADKFEIENP